MLKVNLKKLEKMEEMSFRNALRLHFDSILLFKGKSYPSAFFLSILSQEEIGKAHLVSDFVWHSVVDKTKLTKKETEKWFGLLYKHPVKQGTFFQNSIFTSHKPSFKFATKVFSGALDTLKQNSVYVGLDRKRGKIDVAGKIKSPFKINRAKAKRQITIVNDYLTDLIVGIRHQYYCWDNESVSRLLNKRLFRELESSWGYKSKRAEQRIKSIKKQLKIKSIFNKH